MSDLDFGDSQFKAVVKEVFSHASGVVGCAVTAGGFYFLSGVLVASTLVVADLVLALIIIVVGLVLIKKAYDSGKAAINLVVDGIK